MTAPRRRVSPDGAIEALAALAGGSDADGRTRIAALDGLGGAGKSTLAARARRRVGAGCTVVAIDDFAHPRHDWDWQRLAAQVLDPLARGAAARYERTDWRTGELLPDGVVVPGGLVLLEGISVLRHEVRRPAPWDLTLWLEVPEPQRRERIVGRDGPAILERWRNEWWGTERAYVARDRPAEHADLIVDAAAPPFLGE